jgi:hypothetical protein
LVTRFIYFVIARPNASPFQVPVWMTALGLRQWRCVSRRVLISGRCATFDACWTRLACLPTLDLRPTGETTMKQTPTLQQNLFNAPTTEAETKVPQNLRTAPLKPLVQALLTDLIAAQKVAAAVPSPKG